MRSRLTAIPDEPAGDDPLDLPGAPAVSLPPRVTQAVERVAWGMLGTALKALSDKALVAVSNLYAMLLAASAFWLWSRVLPSPTMPQLVGLGMYGLFVLAMLLVRRRG